MNIKIALQTIYKLELVKTNKMLPFNKFFFLSPKNNNNGLTLNDRDLNKIYPKAIRMIIVMMIKVDTNELGNKTGRNR